MLGAVSDPLRTLGRNPLYLDWGAGRGWPGAWRGPAAPGPSPRRVAPVFPLASTARELRDRRRSHARPNSRLVFDRMHKAGYRGEHHLWSGRLFGDAGRPDRRIGPGVERAA